MPAYRGDPMSPGRRSCCSRDGGADGNEVEGDVLVGADGLHSVVRARLHGYKPPRYAGYTAWRAVITAPDVPLCPGESWGRGARFGHARVPGGRVYVYATRNAPEGVHGPGGELAELRRIFGAWHDPIPALLTAMEGADILRNDILDRPALRRWGTGRITLLGDAAHPMTPNLGQGACQALEDAVVLARQMGSCGAVEPALRRYESRPDGSGERFRRPVSPRRPDGAVEPSPRRGRAEHPGP